MYLLIAGLALFYIPHIARIVAPNLREAGIVRLGEMGWKGAYALVSLAGLALIIFGWMQYRPEARELYVPPSWGIHAHLSLMLVAFIFQFASYQPAGRIKAFVRHPFVWSFILWSGGHLLANGDVASAILFGSFFVYSVLTLVSVLTRDEPVPVFRSYRGDIFGVGVGVVSYAVFTFWVHGFLFGVPVF